MCLELSERSFAYIAAEVGLSAAITLRMLADIAYANDFNRQQLCDKLHMYRGMANMGLSMAENT